MIYKQFINFTSRNICFQRAFKRCFKTTVTIQHNVSWIRPATEEEIMFDKRQKLGEGINSFLVRLRTSKNIEGDDIESALRILTKNIQALRICLQKKDGEVWLKEYEEELIDFKVVHDADIHEEFDKEMHTGYDSEKGPLWRVRLLPWNDKQVNFEKRVKLFYPSGNQKTFRDIDTNVCHFTVTFHHGIIDGFSAIFILRKLMDVMNNNIDGIVTDFDNIKSFDAYKKEKMVNQIAEQFQNNSELLETRMIESQRSFKRPKFLDVFSPKRYPDKKLKSETFYGMLGEESTRKFAELCKKHGVTIHVGITSVLNSVLANHLEEAGVKNDCDDITSVHCVNERSLHEDSFFDLGLVMGKMRYQPNTPRDISTKNFWEYAQDSHIYFKQKLKSIPSYEESALKSISCFELPQASPEHPDMMSPTLHYYNISNVLDITQFFPATENIAVEWFAGTNSCHFGLFLWISVFSTFRGKLRQSFTYNNHLMDAEVAERVFDDSFHFIHKLTSERKHI